MFLEQKLSLTVRLRTLHCDVSRTSLMRQHNFTCAIDKPLRHQQTTDATSPTRGD